MWALLILTAAFVPSEAYAWGPGAHLYFAGEVLRFSSLLPETIRSLITAYHPDFLYGCIAADITLGKAYVKYIHNCHNFSVGMKLLDQTRGKAEKSFAYGYLSHLAADTVSHNFFVPYQNLRHLDHRLFRHAYWEIRFDQFFDDDLLEHVREVVANPRNHTHDQLLDRTLKKTIFSFRTNRFLFGKMLAIQRIRKWHKFVARVNRKSKRRFNETHIAEYNILSVCAIFRLFNEWKKSCVYKVDPTGTGRLAEAKFLRKKLRKLKRARKLTKQMHDEECEKFRKHVYQLHFASYPIKHKGFKSRLGLAL